MYVINLMCASNNMPTVDMPGDIYRQDCTKQDHFNEAHKRKRNLSRNYFLSLFFFSENYIKNKLSDFAHNHI